MQTIDAGDDSARVFVRRSVVYATALSVFLAIVGCDRQHPQPVAKAEAAAPAKGENAQEPAPGPEPRMQKGDVWNEGQPSDVTASWYEVPAESLAKRRAGLEELSAAHNRLPIGTLVRVTHLANGKSVNVRITDRGIHDRSVKLDLCKEAAEELGMLSKGTARVRMQVIDEPTKVAGEAGSASTGSPAAAQR
jgi:rare lipoprotein A